MGRMDVYICLLPVYCVFSSRIVYDLLPLLENKETCIYLISLQLSLVDIANDDTEMYEHVG